jgi:AcrR family transcriptional regulator
LHINAQIGGKKGGGEDSAIAEAETRGQACPRPKYLLPAKYTNGILEHTTGYYTYPKGIYMKASTREREHNERERDILDAATRLFCENGFDNTSMDDLARESEYTKKTIYRYFTCKEDIFFAVITEGYAILIEMLAASSSEECSAFENLIRAYYAFYDFYKKKPQFMQLMAMKGMIQAYSMNKDVPYREKLDERTAIMFGSIIDLFVRAKAEKSIRADLDVTHLAYSSIFLMTSFFHLFSLTGESFTRYLKMDREDFAHFCLNRLLDIVHKKGR